MYVNVKLTLILNYGLLVDWYFVPKELPICIKIYY